MPPETSRSPDWLRDGFRPTHGPTFFEAVNRVGSSTVDLLVSVTTAPTPSIDISRRQTGFSCAIWRTRRSSPANSCRKDARARSIGPVAASNIELQSASSRIRCSYLPREMAPTFNPKFRNSPRMDISKAIIPCCMAFRAPSTARTSCAEKDLQ